jgi:hypothetical protein
MRQIATKVSAREAVVVATCSGLCRSSLGLDFGVMLRALNALLKLPFTRSAEEVSRTIVRATTLGEESHGEFWMNDGLVTYVRTKFSYNCWIGLTLSQTWSPCHV